VKPRIRLALPTDSGAIADIYAPAITDNATSFEATPPDAAEIARRIESLRAVYPWLVCDEDGELLGYAYASRHRERAGYRWSVEVSAYVHPAAQRRGIGKALYTSLFSILALQGFRNAYAGIALPNPASEALHKAVGFTIVGVFHNIGYKHGAWQDVMWLERQLDHLEKDPAAKRLLAEIENEPAFAAALAIGETHLQRRNS
jgi:L-amino acid N-acyltransferase YncA